jgi:hypothetical protein
MKIKVLREHAKKDVAYQFNGRNIPKRYIKLVEQIHVIEQQLIFYHFRSCRVANQLRNELMREVYEVGLAELRSERDLI